MKFPHVPFPTGLATDKSIRSSLDLVQYDSYTIVASSIAELEAARHDFGALPGHVLESTGPWCAACGLDESSGGSVLIRPDGYVESVRRASESGGQ